MAERNVAAGKRATGIPGLDAATHGGLMTAGATLVLGDSAVGKTVFALHIVAAAVDRGEGAVFVSFEESPEQIARNAASFQWGQALTDSAPWQIIDARPRPEVAAAGSFDLQGLVAAIGAAVGRLSAGWVVIDGVDRLLRLQPDGHRAVEQVAELDRWCEQRGVTLLLTGKSRSPTGGEPAYLAGIEFLLSSVLVLSAELVGRRLNRRFRIAKYRGTPHTTDELAMVIDEGGIQLPYDPGAPSPVPASTERASTGMARLDEVLGGGIYRGSTVLVSGEPGTAKTTLAAACAAAAAERGEAVLYVSFDELADRIIRNLDSVGIGLQRHVDSGRLLLVSREAWSALVEEHFIAIGRLVRDHRPDFLVIDPVSALLKAASAESALQAIERLLGVLRAQGVTTWLTSLVERDLPQGESTLSHASTLADTWIALSYQIRGGERNRTLSVVKSRGSAHSNQVRELLLSNRGIDLADVFQFGSEVLLGTARLEKEQEEAARQRQRAHDREQSLHELGRRLEQTRNQVREAELEAGRLETELERERQAHAAAQRALDEHRADVVRRRQPGRGPNWQGEDS